MTEKLSFVRYRVEDLPETQRTQIFFKGVAAVDALKRFLLQTEEESDDGISQEESDNDEKRMYKTKVKDTIEIEDTDEKQTEEQTDDSDSEVEDPEEIPRRETGRRRSLPARVHDYILFGVTNA